MLQGNNAPSVLPICEPHEPKPNQPPEPDIDACVTVVHVLRLTKRSQTEPGSRGRLHTQTTDNPGQTQWITKQTGRTCCGKEDGGGESSQYTLSACVELSNNKFNQ